MDRFGGHRPPLQKKFHRRSRLDSQFPRSSFPILEAFYAGISGPGGRKTHVFRYWMRQRRDRAAWLVVAPRATFYEVAEAGEVLFGFGDGESGVDAAVFDDEAEVVAIVGVIDEGFGGALGMREVEVNAVGGPGSPIEAAITAAPFFLILTAGEAVNNVVKEIYAAGALRGTSTLERMKRSS